MCLITKNKRPRKAIKNITVYKILILVDANRGMFHNFWFPSKTVEYFLNVEHTEEMVAITSSPFNLIFFKDHIKPSEIVIGPGIHSFSSLKRARAFIGHEPDQVRIVKCIIPKGAEYYCEEATQSMVSNKIIPIQSLYRKM